MQSRFAIVGFGVAGFTAAQSLVRADPQIYVDVFGAESHIYYPRPRLWEYIAGQVEWDDLFMRSREWYAERNIRIHTGKQVTQLDPNEHTLSLEDGTRLQYERLLLATGGHPFVPPLEGIQKNGVFSLRTLDHARAIKNRAAQVDRAVVIGGGLLGLETARALRTVAPQVTVLETAPHFLPRQLDAQGAHLLQTLLEAQGLELLTNAHTEMLLGGEEVQGVRLQDGRVIPGGLVLFSTGIRSHTQLAQQAGLTVNRGIVVDDHLATSVPDVFAVGDAAEFNQRVYGIIPAATEQAQVAAANMLDHGSQRYVGTIPNTTLKVAGATVVSLGMANQEDDRTFQILRRTDAQAGTYRKLVLRDGVIQGAVLINDRKPVRSITQLMRRAQIVEDQAKNLLNPDFDFASLI